MIHPITPPPELVQQWISKFYGTHLVPGEAGTDLATRAAQWGADYELEACCAFIDADSTSISASELRAARRSKSPSLAKQGCDALDAYIYGNPDHKDKERTYNTIRAALERLKELEKGNE
jgi:hypothetical protein